jgi:hypothetical protein
MKLWVLVKIFAPYSIDFEIILQKSPALLLKAGQITHINTKLSGGLLKTLGLACQRFFSCQRGADSIYH